MADNEEGEEYEPTKSEWTKLKEKAKRDFSEISDRNQQKVAETKTKIAEYAKGVLNTETQEQTQDISSSNASIFNTNLAQLAGRAKEIFQNSNSEFQKNVDDVKLNILQTFQNSNIKQMESVQNTCRNDEINELLVDKMDDLKETVRTSFFNINEETQRRINETKLKIKESLKDFKTNHD